MTKLPRFTLEKNQSKERWELQNAQGKVTDYWDTKAEATRAGVLENSIGKGGGSVSIRKENGRMQEERTYPGSRDPRKSPG